MSWIRASCYCEFVTRASSTYTVRVMNSSWFMIVLSFVVRLVGRIGPGFGARD
jgi:hypothetical protein